MTTTNKPHDEILVAQVKGLLLSGWKPKQIAHLLDLNHHVVCLWSSKTNFKNIKPDFRIAKAITATIAHQLDELNLCEYADNIRRKEL